MQQALEQRILENFDDLEAFSVYADWLLDRGDPRGELIRVQLALEDAGLSLEQREALRGREKALLDAHARAWLGPLAGPLLDAKPRSPWRNPRWTFQRGWLTALEVPRLDRPLVEALKAAEDSLFLRRLSLLESDSEQVTSALADVSLPHVRVLRFGDGRGRIWEEGLAATLASGMPMLEELSVSGRQVRTNELFRLSLPHLRRLEVACAHAFDTAALAANASLSQLASLTLFPHALEPDDEPDGYLGLQDLEAIARSPHLRGLRELALYCCTAGDEGCRVLVASGLLGQLDKLALEYGEITDEGAKMLAGCPELSRLELLDLRGNSLTEAGVALLKALGLPRLQVENQQSWDEDREYLNYGDCE